MLKIVWIFFFESLEGEAFFDGAHHFLLYAK